MAIPRGKLIQGPSSRARVAFADNCADVRSYYAIHQAFREDTTRLRKRLQVLDKAMYVLVAALWESYCEDVVTEALQLLATYCSGPTQLPKGLRQMLARELKADKNELAAWNLADSGWRELVRTRSTEWSRQRDWRFNSPKSANVDEHFRTALGLERLSDCWASDTQDAAAVRAQLDHYMQVRGSIAHRSDSVAQTTKAQVKGFVNLVVRLVQVIDDQVEAELTKCTSLTEWPKAPELGRATSSRI